MLSEAIRLLLIDDDEEDYVLTRDLLDEIADVQFDLEWLPDVDRAVDAILEGGHDLYLVDYSLGRRDGLSIIREAVARGAGGPIILLTGRDERAIDLDAMSAGAADFLEKWRLNPTLLERSIRYSLQERRHAEELERRVQERTAELARANAALREADRRKNEYLSTLAHELRNPLNPIRNALAIMRLVSERPPADPAAVLEENRAMIERQVKHIIRLIDDLMVVARISRGLIQLKPGPVAVDRLAATAEQDIRPYIARRKQEFEVTLPDDLPVIRADEERMAQVLYNLLHNAAKYTEPGGRIGLHVAREGEGVLFRVVDDGPGVPEGMRESIFDIFTQVKREGDEVASGLGVGLWLVRRLVELHGGRVSLRPGPGGKGSEFAAWVPISPPDGAEFA